MTKRAVMVSVDRVDDGVIRISLDDLIQSGPIAGWRKDVPYTHKEYDEKDFESLKFDEKELADFGYSIIARLHAFQKQNKTRG